MSRVGGQLATGRRRGSDRLHVFHVDARGVLCATAENAAGWSAVPLPQADGLPFGTDLHPPGALTTGYQQQGGQLDLFAVDRDGMLRIYIAAGERAWEADVVPDATGIPPGACLATGYQRGGAVLDVFAVGRTGEPLVFQGTDNGRWRSAQVPLDTALPHGANLATGYQTGGTLLSVFAIDRGGELQVVAESTEGAWQAESVSARLSQAFTLPPGAPLATGYPGGGGELYVFVVDADGRLRAFNRERHGWQTQVLPGAGLHSPAALATGYQNGGRQLLVFVVDVAGRLRQYAHGPDGTWSVGIVPNGVGLPPGAALATGYRAGSALLDVFVQAEFSEPPLYYTAQGGGWTGPYRI